MKAYEIKISLNGIKPPIWRKVIIPSDINFMQLHNIIQLAMGWQNCHLYEFNFKEFEEIITNDSEACDEYEYSVSKEGKKRFAELGLPFHLPKSLYAKEVKIDKYLEKSAKFKYIYDFGDDWEHTIELVKVIDAYVGRLPYVTKFKRVCPPEDCGGVDGYYEVSDALNNPSDPQNKEILKWLKKIHYSNEYDIEYVNEAMTDILDADFDEEF